MSDWDHGRPQGEKQVFAHPGNWDDEPKVSGKPEVSSLIPIIWYTSGNGSLFAGMTLTLQGVKFTVLVSCRDMACSSLKPLLCLRSSVSTSGEFIPRLETSSSFEEKSGIWEIQRFLEKLYFLGWNWEKLGSRVFIWCENQVVIYCQLQEKSSSHLHRN